jgi:hypothetical protein
MYYTYTNANELCSSRELSINLQCQTNNENALVPGNLTRVKKRGAAAGCRISEEATGVRPCEGSLYVRCSNLRGESCEDGVLERAQPESLNFWWIWHGQIDRSVVYNNALGIKFGRRFYLRILELRSGYLKRRNTYRKRERCCPPIRSMLLVLNLVQNLVLQLSRDSPRVLKKTRISGVPTLYVLAFVPGYHIKCLVCFKTHDMTG